MKARCGFAVIFAPQSRGGRIGRETWTPTGFVSTERNPVRHVSLTWPETITYSALMKIKRFCGWVALTCVVAGSSILASAADQTDAVDEYVRSEMTKQHVPGLALLVSRDGKIVRAQGYGLANVELQVPVKPETIFQSGSVGKQFTATAVMMLVEEGKIGLDDPLTKYFPDGPADLEAGHDSRIVEPYGRIHGLSKGLRFSEGLQRG